MFPIRSTPSLPPDPPPLVSPSPPSPRSLSPPTHLPLASSPVASSHMATPQRDLSAQRAALQASLAARTLHWSTSESKQAKRGEEDVGLCIMDTKKRDEETIQLPRNHPRRRPLSRADPTSDFSCSLWFLSMNKWNKNWINFSILPMWNLRDPLILH